MVTCFFFYPGCFFISSQVGLLKEKKENRDDNQFQFWPNIDEMIKTSSKESQKKTSKLEFFARKNLLFRNF